MAFLLPAIPERSRTELVSRKEQVDVGGLAVAYNDLGFKLLARLSEAGGERNVFISPAGVAFSLAVLLNGAGGETRRALSDILKAGGETPEAFNHANRALRASLLRPAPGVLLALAAALWADEGVSFDSSFLKVVSRFYEAEARSLDFTSEAAAEAINEWARERTRGKIESLVEPSDLQEPASCVLANAVYFKGSWETKFDEAATRDGPFRLQNGRRRSVPLMSGAGTYPYFEDGAAQFISLPYSGRRASACFLLPPPPTPLREFLAGLDAERWDGLVGRLEERRVELTLPRFALTYEADLRAPLAQLGLGVAFGVGADFGPMGIAGHFISKFKHKAAAEVNEEGTEAAAATAVIMARSLFRPPRMVVDRPFFWAIRDDASSVLLFVGAVFDPGSLRH